MIPAPRGPKLAVWRARGEARERPDGVSADDVSGTGCNSRKVLPTNPLGQSPTRAAALRGCSTERLARTALRPRPHCGDPRPECGPFHIRTSGKSAPECVCCRSGVRGLPLRSAWIAARSACTDHQGSTAETLGRTAGRQAPQCVRSATSRSPGSETRSAERNFPQSGIRNPECVWNNLRTAERGSALLGRSAVPSARSAGSAGSVDSGI